MVARLAVAERVNSVVINVQRNMVAGTRQINMGIFLTNPKLPPIQSVLQSRRQYPSRVDVLTLTMHLCNGLNDKNLVKPRKTCFLTV